MLITRIEFEGAAGHLTIEKAPGGPTIRIDSVLRNPDRHQQVWKTWELPAAVGDEDLFKVAVEVQQRTDGCNGTNSMVHDYFRDMQRFQD